MNSSLFQLPTPLPRGAVLVGPTDWLADFPGESDPSDRFDDPREALASLNLRAESGGTSGPTPLIFLHQDVFAGPDGCDRLVAWLEDLTRSADPYLCILLHADLTGHQLVRFFRAGLFDALNVPVTKNAWVNLLLRAEKRRERRHQSSLLLQESGETRNLLHGMHREVEGQASRNAGELLKAQESLEAANQHLTEAMSELSLLYKFGRELSQASNWDGVLRNILQSLSDYVQAGGAALILRSAPGGSYSPRKTWHWEESSWDKVLVNLQDQVDDAVAESIMAPGVFSLAAGEGDPDGGSGQRIIALPLEYQDIRLGYLLLLFSTTEARREVSRRYLPFLQTVQVVLSEEVAGAQMLDRIRDIGAFNSRVLETVRSAIWVINEEGQTVYCNRAGQEMLTGQPSCIAVPEDFTFQIGRDRHQLDAQHYGELPELFLDARLQIEGIEGLIYARIKEKAQEEFRGEGRIRCSDGQGIPVAIQTALMTGRSRNQTWLVVVAEDLRESRKLAAERRKREQLEGLVEMSATLAHEIRNPLMGLSAQAELLAERLPPGDPKSRYIQVITGEVDRINDTITRMLNYVRPYAPRLDSVDLRELSQDVKDLVQPRGNKRFVKIDLEFSDMAPDRPAWEHRLDGGQIKQVLLNLMINGVDAAPDGGQVLLTLSWHPELDFLDPETGSRRRASGYRFDIADNGPGIPKDQLEKIFRPFYTTKNTGTGLGLSICQKIVSAHGGEIQVNRHDTLTVFSVMLPLSAEGAEAHATQEEEA
jgi:signal transduction histidine kinase|nr:ATP-binding protein [Candidatus Krumholzibacteria bacterium]